MQPQEITRILKELGVRPNKALGQHFLIDEVVLEVIVNAADVRPGERILEIGPGLGVLTRAFIDRGASVTAIEQDRVFVAYLERSVGSSVHVIHGDAARLDWSPLVVSDPWKMVANLPYSISSLALRKALWTEHPPESVTVLVQREVAERAIAKDGKGSLLSLMVALATKSAEIVENVPADAFFPPPKVESAVLHLIPQKPSDRIARWGIEPERIMQLAKKGFAHPRKLLASNLELTKEQRAIFVGLGLKETVRAEELGAEDWAELTKRLPLSS